MRLRPLRLHACPDKITESLCQQGKYGSELRATHSGYTLVAPRPPDKAPNDRLAIGPVSASPVYWQYAFLNAAKSDMSIAEYGKTPRRAGIKPAQYDLIPPLMYICLAVSTYNAFPFSAPGAEEVEDMTRVFLQSKHIRIKKFDLISMPSLTMFPAGILLAQFDFSQRSLNRYMSTYTVDLTRLRYHLL